MPAVLVSGAEQQVARMAAALESEGATVTSVTDLDDMPSVSRDAGTNAFDAYVQLASTFSMQGTTAIERVHHFYANGVLARFPALQAALPALRSGATVVFVLGHLPTEVASDDDRSARESLTKVLAHAARADASQGALSVHLLGHATPLDEIVGVTLGRQASVGPGLQGLSDLDYADWRVEVLGLVAFEI